MLKNEDTKQVAVITSEKWLSLIDAGDSTESWNQTARPFKPDGEYVVLEYETSFERKKDVTEIVTQMKDADGEWRATGYLIR
ncbi:MAG: DUF4019 domain-containing protein [Pyrinomonadaceae bacterium]|nr:DUF4019 domain-containing protein [Pyrinomonadaceae bacterium]